MLSVLVSLQIVELNNEKELLQFTHMHQFVFIKFYMEHCAHCQHLAPRFVDLEDLQPPAKLAQFSCDGNDYCRLHEIYGVPTLQLYRNGTHVATYESEWRDPKPMLKWLQAEVAKPIEHKEEA